MKKLLFVLAFILVGCERQPRQGSERRQQTPSQDKTVYGESGRIEAPGQVTDMQYVIDRERNVICYRFVGREGISCLHMSPADAPK